MDAVVEREFALTIRFYGHVSLQSAAQFQRCFAGAGAGGVASLVPGDRTGPPVVVLLQSDGGEVFSGMACMDAIEAAPAPVVVVAEGVVASAATFLLVGAHRRIARPSACLLVHQASTCLPSDALRPDELRDEAANAESISARVRDVYVARTSMTEERVEALLRREIYLSSEQAMEAGLVHEIAPVAC